MREQETIETETGAAPANPPRREPDEPVAASAPGVSATTWNLDPVSPPATARRTLLRITASTKVRGAKGGLLNNYSFLPYSTIYMSSEAFGLPSRVSAATMRPEREHRRQKHWRTEQRKCQQLEETCRSANMEATY
jgi:hypothetical protein